MGLNYLIVSPALLIFGFFVKAMPGCARVSGSRPPRLAQVHLRLREINLPFAPYRSGKPDPEILLVLGDLQLASGRQANPRAAWEKGLANFDWNGVQNAPGTSIRDAADLLDRLADAGKTAL
jgi:hypothetical protein